MITALVIAIYLVIALFASWLLSEGYAIDFYPPTLLIFLSLLWPLLLLALFLSFLVEEHQLNAKSKRPKI